MSAELAVQRALGDRLASAGSIVSLVPGDHIADRHSRPLLDPSIVIGEGQTIEGGDIARAVVRIVLDLHIWKKEVGTAGVKAIAGAIRSEIKRERLVLDNAFHCGDCRVTHSRFLRDPDGETAHGIVTVEAVVKEV